MEKTEKNKNGLTGKIMITAIVVFLILASIILFNRPHNRQRKHLRVMAAVILKNSFSAIAKEFEEKYPDVEVLLETQPSVVITRLAPLRNCDVLAVVDSRLIEKMLAPKKASWAVKFACTEMVLVYSGKSKYKDKISADNWYDIILQKDVKYGYSDPTLNPAGYFTLLCWKMAEDYYFKNKNRKLYNELVNNCPKNNVIYDPPTLLSVLQTPGALDYAFVPRPHAEDLSLPYIKLPKEINCGYPPLEKHYNKYQIDVPNYRGGTETINGSYMDISITIPNEAVNKDISELFVKFVLSKKVEKILSDSGFHIIKPPVIPNWCTEVPDFFKS